MESTEMKTSELTGAALDWEVCEATGLLDAYPLTRKRFLKQWSGNSGKFLHPSTDWAQGGPIIEREEIHLAFLGNKWMATKVMQGYTPNEAQIGPTPLVAAMRCFVASKLGDGVEIPKELM
jgi:hypothetical protein